MPEGYHLKGIIFKLVHLIHVYDCYVWAQIVLKMRKTLHFKQLQISVDGVLLIRD